MTTAERKRVTHLNKGGLGWASRTACGRNLLRTPMSANWNEFKQEPVRLCCTKCLNSKQFAYNLKTDEKKVA